MSRKLAILFAVLALASVANCTVGTASPSSAFSITPGKILENVTDTAFTNLTGTCHFTAGFDNTTNYVWCEAQTSTSNSQTFGASWGQTIALVLQRRAINASSPSTKNATLDTKITTTAMYTNNGGLCPGVGYIGIGYDYVSTGTQTDVSFQYIAVNGTSATTVKITSNTDTDLANTFQQCMFDNGIFYIVYTQKSVTANTYTKNKVLIQAVNVTSGAVVYNTTGGITLASPTTGTLSTYFGFGGMFATNWTGYGSTLGLIAYTDSSTAGATKSYVLPVTLATGAPGSAVLVGTGSTANPTATSTSTDANSRTCTSNSVVTTYDIVGGIGSLSTYGVIVRQTVATTPYSYTIALPNTDPCSSTTTDYTTAGTATNVYTNSVFLNGSSTASTSFNFTADPSGYKLSSAQGYSTNDGFGVVATYASTASSPAADQINLNTFYANGTAILSGTSLGTYGPSGAAVQIWQDAAGSPWLGYVLTETDTGSAAGTGLFLLSSAYAGEIATNILSAATLSSIFATLTLMIVALFAF